MIILKQLALYSLLTCCVSSLYAATPTSFHAQYDAKFQGFRAQAQMSLTQGVNQVFELSSTVNLKLLGKSISSINERSIFTWEHNAIAPQTYFFTQKGIRKRTRSIHYDWSNLTAKTLVDGNVETLNLDDKLLNELSLFTEIKLQLANKVNDIYIDLIDKNEIKQYHFKVLGEELVQTPLGQFNAIKVERIRAEGSQRSTQLWFAKDWEFLLVKLSQHDKGKKFEINLRQATLGSSTVVALP